VELRRRGLAVLFDQASGATDLVLVAVVPTRADRAVIEASSLNGRASGAARLGSPEADRDRVVCRVPGKWPRNLPDYGQRVRAAREWRTCTLPRRQSARCSARFAWDRVSCRSRGTTHGIPWNAASRRVHPHRRGAGSGQLASPTGEQPVGARGQALDDRAVKRRRVEVRRRLGDVGEIPMVDGHRRPRAAEQRPVADRDRRAARAR